jgi:hypothetical protein
MGALALTDYKKDHPAQIGQFAACHGWHVFLEVQKCDFDNPNWN